MIWNCFKSAVLGTVFVVGMFAYTLLVLGGMTNVVYALTGNGFISVLSATIIIFFFLTFFIGAVIDYHNDWRYRCG